MDVDGAASSSSSKKNVSFASDTKPGSSSSAKEPSVKKEDSKAGILAKKPPPPPEGQIGTLLVMKSGKVKMRLGKDIYLDVSGLVLLSPFLRRRGPPSFSSASSELTSSLLTPLP